MKTNPIAITVPKDTKNCCEENRNDKNPITSVKIATSKAADVSIAPVLTADLLTSKVKSLRLSLPIFSLFSTVANSSLTRITTCKP